MADKVIVTYQNLPETVQQVQLPFQNPKYGLSPVSRFWGLEASINEWGSGGSTGWFDVLSTMLPGGTTERNDGSSVWNRSDTRGFIMALSCHGSTGAYYVLAGDVITISPIDPDNKKAAVDYRVTDLLVKATNRGPLTNIYPQKIPVSGPISVTYDGQNYGPCEASINQWESDGETQYFSLTPKQAETWNRTDSRGFVLSLNFPTSTFNAPSYYVFSGENIQVTGATDVPGVGILNVSSDRGTLTPLTLKS